MTREHVAGLMLGISVGFGIGYFLKLDEATTSRVTRRERNGLGGFKPGNTAPFDSTLESERYASAT